MKCYKHTYQGLVSEGLNHIRKYPVSIRENTKYHNTYMITLKDTDRKSPSYFIRYGAFKNKGERVSFVSLIMAAKKDDHVELFIEVKGLSFIIFPFIFMSVGIIAQIEFLIQQPVAFIPLQIFLTCFNILLAYLSTRIIFIIIGRVKLFRKIINELGGGVKSDICE